MLKKIEIQNLKCGGCSKTISRRLIDLSAVSEVKVDLEDSSVFVKLLDESKLDEVYNKLRDLGYPSVDDKNSVFSKAKSIVSCASGRLN